MKLFRRSGFGSSVTYAKPPEGQGAIASAPVAEGLLALPSPRVLPPPKVATLDTFLGREMASREASPDSRNSSFDRRPSYEVGPFGKIRMTPLMRACAEGDLDAAREEVGRVSKSALTSDIDDWAGSTALHWAAYRGHHEIVRLLLDHGADALVRNRRDQATPLHLAARYNKLPAALEMLATAAPKTLNIPNAKGNTPLHEASYEGRVRNAAVLIYLRADVEAVNDSTLRGGLTPLLAAAEYGHLALVRLLLQEGANTETAPKQARRVRSSMQSPSRRPGGVVTPISAAATTSRSIFARGRRSTTHHRIDLEPAGTKVLDEFALPGEGVREHRIKANARPCNAYVMPMYMPPMVPAARGGRACTGPEPTPLATAALVMPGPAWFATDY